MKTIAICLILVLSLMCLPKTRDFHPSKIKASFPFHKEWEIEKSAAIDLSSIFNQPYAYLADGTQTYAFESKDRQYVIKFFKMKHLQPKPIMKWLPIFFKKQIAAKEKKLQKTFQSYKIAYDLLPLETGTLWLHLNQTSALKQKIVLIDKHNHRHLVDLDHTSFVVQRKGELIYERLNRLIQEKREKEVAAAISQVLSLVRRRCALGIGDRDQGVRNNYGFIGDHPIHIDTGEYYLDERLKEPKHLDTEVRRIANKIADATEIETNLLKSLSMN